MIIKTFLKYLDKIKNIFISYLRNNYSEKVIDILEIVLFGFLLIITIYFIFVAFTEILLILILFILIMIYRKL